MIGPILHHHFALGWIFGVVVCCADVISFSMRQLTLDPIAIKTLFIQKRGCGGAKAVNGQCALFIAHATQCRE
jgi:hypothetical protein